MLQINAQQADAILQWPALIAALRAAHRDAGSQHIQDMILGPQDRSLLVRAAFFEGLGIGLKAVTIFPENSRQEPPRSSVQGAFLLFSEADGQIVAAIDSDAITPWKTAADSALGCDLLASPTPKTLAMIGAGAMAKPLIEAHLTVRPSIEEIVLWNRTRANAERLAGTVNVHGRQLRISDDLQSTIQAADIVCTATMSTTPIVKGAWLKPGAHIDLVGAFRSDMREADDETLLRSRVFVDAFETTLHHIGELLIPIQAGTIAADSIEGDLFTLCNGMQVNRHPQDITVFKNGGGAHLDLMVAHHIYAQIGQLA